MRRALRSVFGSMPALVTLTLVLCLFILVLNVEVGLAQESSSDFNQREKNIARLDRARQLACHTRFLRKVAKSSPRIEVVWNMENVF